MASVCKDFEAEWIEFDGEDDHVHPFGDLSAQSDHFYAGEQFERRVQPPDPKEKLSANSSKAVVWARPVP
ncbi:protein of unknown function [Kyrpidia spormannii]|uniref:Uncharacterized protein n=2 Tax=Kyrpidia spormannii TaxID=2055160 RepID=A0ACA8ZCS7_9BACL|nr:protein of unknown function [Kyrpidia spormannii]CAB3395264.1 protein of unknown function [Kyrpidia spormannii]